MVPDRREPLAVELGKSQRSDNSWEGASCQGAVPWQGGGCQARRTSQVGVLATGGVPHGRSGVACYNDHSSRLVGLSDLIGV